MSEDRQKKVYQERQGYQAKVDKPPGKPPTGGSAVKKPPSSDQKN